MVFGRRVMDDDDDDYGEFLHMCTFQLAIALTILVEIVYDLVLKSASMAR